MVFTAVDQEDARVVYIAPTFQAARDIAWELLKKRIKGLPGLSINETRLEVDIPNRHKGMSKISLRSWDSVETLRGQFFDLIILDEIAHIRNFWSNWQEVLTPTLTDRKGKALFISTPLGFNHFFDLCNTELKDKDFKTFHFTSYDNPHLPKDELDSVKEKLPPDRFEQEYMASFQKTEGLVYKEFRRDKHLYDDLPHRNPEFGEQPFRKYGGIDFGYRNPAAILDIRFDGERVYVEDEWYKRERTDIQIAEYVKLYAFEAVYPDPENAGAIEELRRKGVNVREVKKGKGSRESGIESVREMLIRGTLKINRKCVNLISEFETYSYRDNEDERNESETPIKAHDHALDALRYVISSLLPLVSRQEQIRQLIQFRQEPRKNPAR